MAQGINPIEAKARIDSLSDDEVIQIANQIDQLPAGGSMQLFPVWVGIAILVGVVLIIYLLISAVAHTEVEK
jgi:hypothetical protein